MAHSGAGAPVCGFFWWKFGKPFGYVFGTPQDKAFEVSVSVSAFFADAWSGFSADHRLVVGLSKYSVKNYENFVGISPFSGLQLWYE